MEIEVTCIENVSSTTEETIIVSNNATISKYGDEKFVD